MKILAFETSTFTASVATWTDQRVSAERENRVTTHSEALLPLVDQVLADAGLALADVDLLACGAGPGSFTGLRIGLATAKGLCFALGKPLVTVSSLATLALEAADRVRVEAAGRSSAPLVLALLDARKGEVYAGLYSVAAEPPVPVAPEAALAPSALAGWLQAALAAAGLGDRDVLVIGEGAQAYPDAAAECGRPAPELRRTPAARVTARLAAFAYEDGGRTNAAAAVATAVPHYIRPSEAEVKFPNGLVNLGPR